MNSRVLVDKRKQRKDVRKRIEWARVLRQTLDVDLERNGFSGLGRRLGPSLDGVRVELGGVLGRGVVRHLGSVAELARCLAGCESAGREQGEEC